MLLIHLEGTSHRWQVPHFQDASAQIGKVKLLNCYGLNGVALTTTATGVTFISYCHVTTYCRFSSLKQHTWIISVSVGRESRLSFVLFFNPHLRIYLLTLEREERAGSGGEGERVRETSIGCLLYAPQLWIKSTTLCPDWNQTHDLLVYGTVL